MKIDLKKIFVKYFLLAFILEVLYILNIYIKNGNIVPFQMTHIRLYYLFILGLFVSWALLEYFQNVTGMLMKESWISRIIFILVALVLFYLYRIKGRV